MALITAPESLPAAPRGRDLWYVSNGESVVGPVQTDVLLRGIAHGRVPESCQVRKTTWNQWRDLADIREVAPLRRIPRWVDTGLPDEAEALDLIGCARCLGEAFLFGLQACVARTHADLGLVHRMRAPFVGLVTSCAYGAGAEALLGEVLREGDPALVAARAGACVLGPANAGEVEGAIARRLAARRLDDAYERTFAGVAMVPVRVGVTLVATIELGRFNHPFREVDLVAMCEVVTITMSHLGRLARAS